MQGLARVVLRQLAEELDLDDAQFGVFRRRPRHGRGEGRDDAQRDRAWRVDAQQRADLGRLGAGIGIFRDVDQHHGVRARHRHDAADAAGLGLVL